MYYISDNRIGDINEAKIIIEPRFSNTNAACNIFLCFNNSIESQGCYFINTSFNNYVGIEQFQRYVNGSVLFSNSAVNRNKINTSCGIYGSNVNQEYKARLSMINNIIASIENETVNDLSISHFSGHLWKKLKIFCNFSDIVRVQNNAFSSTFDEYISYAISKFNTTHITFTIDNITHDFDSNYSAATIMESLTDTGYNDGIYFDYNDFNMTSHYIGDNNNTLIGCCSNNCKYSSSDEFIWDNYHINDHNVYINIRISVLYNNMMETIMNTHMFLYVLFIQIGNSPYYTKDSLNYTSVHICSNWQHNIILHLIDTINFVIQDSSGDNNNNIVVNSYAQLPSGGAWRTYVLNEAIEQGIILSNNCQLQFYDSNILDQLVYGNKESFIFYTQYGDSIENDMYQSSSHSCLVDGTDSDLRTLFQSNNLIIPSVAKDSHLNSLISSDEMSLNHVVLDSNIVWNQVGIILTSNASNNSHYEISNEISGILIKLKLAISPTNEYHSEDSFWKFGKGQITTAKCESPLSNTQLSKQMVMMIGQYCYIIQHTIVDTNFKLFQNSYIKFYLNNVTKASFVIGNNNLVIIEVLGVFEQEIDNHYLLYCLNATSNSPVTQSESENYYSDNYVIGLDLHTDIMKQFKIMNHGIKHVHHLMCIIVFIANG